MEQSFRVWMRQLSEFKESKTTVSLSHQILIFNIFPPPSISSLEWDSQKPCGKKRKLRGDQEGKREAKNHVRTPRRGLGSRCHHGWGLTDEGFTEVLSSSQSFASTTRKLVTIAPLRKAEVTFHGSSQWLGCPQGLPSTSRRVQVLQGPGAALFYLISKATPETSFKGYLRGPRKTSLCPKIHHAHCIYKNTHPPEWESEKLCE